MAGTENNYETQIKPFLDEIREAVESGGTAKSIAAALGISSRTLSRWVKKAKEGTPGLEELKEIFTKSAAFADEKVERALFQRACGMKWTEVKEQEVLDGKTGQVMTLRTVTKKFQPPDPTSAIFWLTNRMPQKWKSGRMLEMAGADVDEADTGVVILPEPGEPPGEELEETVIEVVLDDENQ